MTNNIKCVVRKTEMCGRVDDNIKKCNVDSKYGEQYENVPLDGRVCDICCKYSFDRNGSNMYYEFKDDGNFILFDKNDDSIDNVKVLDKLSRQY